MPEGDTIYRTAQRLRQVLVAQTLNDVRAPRGNVPLESLMAQRVEQVESRGKHLLIHLQNGFVIHSHMGMTGSWHIYAPPQAWRKPENWAQLVLVTSQHECVCFTPKLLEILLPKHLQRHTQLTQLGPDLLSPAWDAERAIDAAQRSGCRPIGEVIMDQRIVSGIGNVYKSELLFRQKIDPFRSAASVTRDEWRALFDAARRALHLNLEGQPRRTRFGRDGQRHWVYGRSGEPCLVCGTRIQMRRQGDLGRSTYWCPTCQPTADPRQPPELS